MKKKQQSLGENYLKKIPSVPQGLSFSTDENGIVTLETENKGMMNRIAQKFFGKPKISYIHLDEFGSFVWQKVDGKTDILTLGESVKKQFGEKADTLINYTKMLSQRKK